MRMRCLPRPIYRPIFGVVRCFRTCASTRAGMKEKIADLADKNANLAEMKDKISDHESNQFKTKHVFKRKQMRIYLGATLTRWNRYTLAQSQRNLNHIYIDASVISTKRSAQYGN